MVSLNFVFLSLALFYLKAFISIGFCFHAFESILRHFTIIFLQIYTTEIWMCYYIILKHHQTICCVHLFHFIVYVGINTRREKINKLHIFLNQRYITPQGKKKKIRQQGSVVFCFQPLSFFQNSCISYRFCQTEIEVYIAIFKSKPIKSCFKCNYVICPATHLLPFGFKSMFSIVVKTILIDGGN